MFQHTAIFKFLNKYAGALLFFLFSFIALFTVDSYGVSWDEDYQREIGLVSWNYIFSNDSTLLSYNMRDYGVAFELPLIALEKFLRLSNERDIYLMRHLVTHLFFLTAAYFCYRLILETYKEPFLAVLGFLLFVLYPPIYSHSFFNTKDLPFLSLLSICFYLLFKALNNKQFFHFLVLGIGIGLLINIRLMGSLLLFCALTLLLYDAIKEKKIWPNFKWMSILVVSTTCVLLLSWPYLWEAPLNNFVTAFKNMSQFRWTHSNLLNGELIPATELPWYYVPLWFGITTPIPYLLIGISGIVLLLFSFFRSPRLFLSKPNKRFSLIYMVFFILPIVAVIVLHSVLYDGWRHLYFIYPAFVMLGVYALHDLVIRFRKGLLFLMSLSFVFIAGWMLLYFPMQHVYFNFMVSRHSEPDFIRKHFEMDYWGLGFKQGLEYILKNDPGSEINVYAEQCSTSNILIMLSERDKKRIHFVPANEATYFITNYRWHPQDYPFAENKVFSIRVFNSSVIDVFKLK